MNTSTLTPHQLPRFLFDSWSKASTAPAKLYSFCSQSRRDFLKTLSAVIISPKSALETIATEPIRKTSPSEVEEIAENYIQGIYNWLSPRILNN